MFQVVHHAGVLDRHVFILESVIEVVSGTLLRGRLRHPQFLEKFFGVHIAVVDSDIFSVDLNVLSDHEVVYTQKVLFVFAENLFLKFQTFFLCKKQP